MKNKATTYRTAARDLVELRELEGLSPEDLGQIVGVDGSTIRRIEANEVRPRIRTRSLLTNHFGLNLWAT